MRKTYFVLLLCSIASVTFAQLKVANNGNVGIQIGSLIPQSALSLNAEGNADTKLSVVGNTNGVFVKRTGTPNYSWPMALVGSTDLGGSYSYTGVRGQALSDNILYAGRAWGLCGLASNATSGYNYGVMGVLYGENNGAGVVGYVANNMDVQVPGRYAGYFVGDVKVTGLINGVTIGNSDLRYKRNVVSLVNTQSKALSAVMLMNPVEYNLEQIFVESKGDSTKVKQGLYDEKSQLFQKKQYGLIAQDLQKLYPDLVYENDNGYLSINYTGLIPILIQSIKELKGEIDLLKSSTPLVKQGAARSSGTGSLSTDISLPSTLYQNTPNSFSQSTQIKYYLPKEVNQALLCIYDMNGKQLKQIVLNERGEGVQTIHGAELAAGIYLYALIADGKEVDVKRMILTE
ncbi:MAG: tail fiber domain-containing protein [Paludibacteraceae bacterium]